MIKLNKNILKIIMVMLFIIALVIPMTSYATDTGSGTVIIAPGGTASPSPEPSDNTTPSPSNETTPSPEVSPTPVNETKLPQTGIEDYTGLMVAIVVLGVSAVFAYIKIKQYKNF